MYVFLGRLGMKIPLWQLRMRTRLIWAAACWAGNILLGTEGQSPLGFASANLGLQWSVHHSIWLQAEACGA